MGNKSSNIALNNRLGVSITKQVTSNSRFPASQRGSILSAFIIFPDATDTSEYAQLYHIITVSPRSIDMFCLLTGEIRSPKYVPKRGIHIMSSNYCKESIKGNILISAESDKSFRIISVFSLTVLSEINSRASSKISCILCPVPDLIYAGFHDGSIKIWHLASEEPQFHFREDVALPSIRTLEFSHVNRFIIAGFENSFQKSDGSYEKLDYNPLRIYYAADNTEKTKPELLEGFIGACLSIVLIENKNFAIALSSFQSGIYIWDFITKTKILNFNVPIMGKNEEIATKLVAIEMPEMSDILLIGKSDGSTVVSQLTLNQEDASLVWSPLQKIQPLLEEGERGINGITFMEYDRKLDAVISGDSSSNVRIISNLFHDCLGIRQVPHEAQEIEQIDNSLEEEKKYEEEI